MISGSIFKSGLNKNNMEEQFEMSVLHALERAKEMKVVVEVDFVDANRKWKTNACENEYATESKAYNDHHVPRLLLFENDDMVRWNQALEEFNDLIRKAAVMHEYRLQNPNVFQRLRYKVKGHVS